MAKIAEYCIRCGLCIDLHPRLFMFDYENDCILLTEKADLPDFLGEIKEMAADCPVAAIQTGSPTEIGGENE